MTEKKQVKEIKKKKKHWVSILAPQEFKSLEIGESYIEEPEHCLQRRVRVNLMTLTRDPKKQNTNITFRVDQIKDNKAYSVVESFELMPAHTKRLTKRAKTKAEDSFVCETKDKKKVRVKIIALSKSKTSNSTMTNVRKETRRIVEEVAKKNSLESFFNEIIRSNLQVQIKKELKKIIPLTAFVIRVAKKV